MSEEINRQLRILTDKDRQLRIDPATGIIILEDGTTYMVAEGVSLEGLQPGDIVTVSFEVCRATRTWKRGSQRLNSGQADQQAQ